MSAQRHKPPQHRGPLIQWPPEHIELLRALWPSGLSSRQIAGQINQTFRTSYSKNAMIGKGHRLGLGPLSNRGSGARPARVPRAAKPVPRRVNFQAQMVVDLRPIDPIPERREDLMPTTDLLHLTAHTCRWPIGDPQSPAFGFCGRHTDAIYCRAHARIAYQPKPPKNIDRMVMRAAA